MAKRTIQLDPCSAQEKSSSFRKLKVRKGHYYYQHADFQPRQKYRFCEPVPWVQIKGYWLNKAGFTIDMPLSVEVQDGCITIKPQTPAS